MQIAVDVTSDEGEVIGAGVVPSLLSGAVGKKWNHDCHRVRTCNRTLNHTGIVGFSMQTETERCDI